MLRWRSARDVTVIGPFKAFRMGQKKELCKEIRLRIVELRKERWTYREIADCLGISKSAVGDTLLRERTTGSTANKPRPNRPRKTDEREDRHIVRDSKKKRSLTGNDLAADIQRMFGKTISSKTARQRLHDKGIRGLAGDSITDGRSLQPVFPRATLLPLAL